jgi:membrane protease YdiL (CAAX protease family)
MRGRDALKVIPWFVLVFAITWALWFTAAGLEPSLLRNVSFYLGVFAPGIVALAMTYRELGASGVRKLLGRLVQWDVGVRWFAFALLFIFSIKVVVALIVRVSTGGWPVFGTVPVPLLFAGAIGSTLFGGQVGEELGWRGYALPRLASAMGLGAASVLLGVIWAIWHLPLFYILGADTVGQSFPFYLLQVTALSVAIAWLYMKTRGSLLLAMLLHAAVNNTKDVVPSAVPGASDPWLLHASMVGWLTLSLLWLCAIGFLVDMRRSGSGNLQRDDEGNIVG